MKKRTDQNGVTLVELMVSIAIGMFLTAGLIQIFVSTKTVFYSQQGISRVQEIGRIGIELLTKDVRQAGYFGCLSRTNPRIFNTLNNSASFYSAFNEDSIIRAYDSSPPGSSEITPAAGTQVLVIRSGVGNSVSTNQNSEPTRIFVTDTGEGSGACISGICPDDIVMVTDCSKARVFQVSALASTGAGSVSLTHLGGAATPGNSITNWGGNSGTAEEWFQPGSDVIVVRSVSYFISDFDGEPALYKQFDANTPFVVLEGIENFNLQFGLDADGDSVVDGAMLDLGDMGAGDWSNVAAISIELLVKSTADTTDNEPDTYTFAGATVTAADNRVRRVFSTSIGLRNRLL